MSRSASTPRDSCRLIAEGRLVRTDFIADPETRRTSPCNSMSVLPRLKGFPRHHRRAAAAVSFDGEYDDLC
jgi:hypothetical protein